MPKKTKREKLLADHRRVQMTNSRQPSFQFQAHEAIPVNTIQTHQATPGDLKLIQQDLLKTVILAMLAIFSEVLLSKIIR